MKYTQHFKKMKIEKGIPHLNHDQHSRYFNIVAIEYHIDQLEKMEINSLSVFNSIHRHKETLERITKGLEPELLLLELVELSN